MADKTIVAEPTMYCKHCWYVLDGLPTHRCPECGVPFDPAKRRTYRTKPRRKYWLGRLLRITLAFVVILGSVVGWIYWQATVEQKAVAKLKPIGVRCLTRPVGPAWFGRWAWQHNLPLPETVVSIQTSVEPWGARYKGLPISDADLRHVRDLRNLQRLALGDTKVTDAGLVHLKDLTNLHQLVLFDTKVTGSGFVHLRNLTELRKLELNGTQVTDAGLAHLTALTKLQKLALFNTQITDPGLAHLAKLVNLQALILDKTQVTDAGLVHLTNLTALKALHLTRTKVTPRGIADLKRALPNTTIYGP